MTTEPAGKGDAILFMKVGTHAAEPLADIIQRKRREISDAGYAMWGYGGNTCHPSTTVQPFAASHAGAGRVIRLCMHPMESKHFAEQVRADEFSTDGFSWYPVPRGINVLGSRYALCIGSLYHADWDLALDQTQVVIGKSKGRSGEEYIKGRVDKACLEVVGSSSSGGRSVHIGLVAEIIQPYAVFLRN